MKKFASCLVIMCIASFFMTACGGVNKLAESAVSGSVAGRDSHASGAPKTGLAKWGIQSAGSEGMHWADFESSSQEAKLRIAPGEDFPMQMKSLLNGSSYNVDEYLCSSAEPMKISGGIEVSLVTCAIPAFQEYQYFISLTDSNDKLNRIYAMGEIGINKYLGKERDGEPERIYHYNISDAEVLPFMDTTAVLVQIDRSFAMSYSGDGDGKVENDYHTFENYIFAGKALHLVGHWSAKHTFYMKDWLSCDKDNPVESVCPSIQTEAVCKSLGLDGQKWKTEQVECD